MIQDFIRFDPKRDFMRVNPGLSVDIAAAVESGTVIDAGTNSDYNQIDDPNSITGRVRDIFEATDRRKDIMNKAAAAAAASAETTDPTE